MTIAKLRLTLTELGTFNGLLYLFDRFFSRISGQKLRIFKYYLMAQPVSDKDFLPPHRGRNIQVRPIDAQDPETRKFPRPYTSIQNRYQQGGNCLAAYINEKFVGYIWLNLGNYQEDEVRCRFMPLPPGQTAWDYDIYVDPDYRLSMAFSRLWDEANNFLRRHGVSWSMSRISAFKPQSISSHSKMGVVRIGTAYFFCCGMLQLMIASVPPYMHISATPQSYPEVALRVKN